MRNFGTNGRGSRPLPRIALAALLALPLAACDLDELLTINDPDVVDPATLRDSTSLPAWRASAVGDFSIAYDGQDAQITYSGMLADEFINSETFPTRIQIDIRRMEETNSSLQGVTRNLYRARTSAENAAAAYRQFSPANTGRSEMFSLASATYMLFGENYCSGVPFSDRAADGSFTYGGQNTTAAIFTRALASADSALAIAGTNTTLQNFARVLRGRALLNLNRPAEAAAAVAGVPTSFRYVLTHSENSPRENNGVHVFNQLNERVSVANREGTNGLPYREAFTAGDPRTPWRRLPATNVGFDRATPQWDQLKYASRSAGTPVATGIEARLIEAEAQLRAGQITAFLATLNALRTSPTQLFFNTTPEPVVGTTTITNTPPAMGALTDPGTDAGRVDLLFRERAYWLWLTSHRLGDMRRLIRQYGRTQAQVFPVGTYHKATQGGIYGTDVNLILSVDERANPEFGAFPSNQSLCLDRNA